MESLNLLNKTIIVTGACGKLGKAMLRMLLQHEAKVVALDRVPASTRPVVQDLLGQYDETRLLYMEMDASNEDEIAAMMEKTVAHFGCIDGMLHSAYSQKPSSIADFQLEEWNKTVHGTLTSTFLLCKHAARHMAKTGGGSIVTSSSILSVKPQANNAAYIAAKAGVTAFTKAFAIEAAADNIRANVIIPGDFKEPESNVNEAFKQGIAEKTLIGRSGTPVEIAEMVLFLLSDASSYVTGSEFVIDGGYQLR